MFPQVGRATVRLLERLGHERRVPGGADLLRSDARQHRLPEGGAADGRATSPTSSHRTTRSSPRPGRASARSATSTRWSRERFGSPDLVEQVEAVAARTYELSELLVDVLGRDRCRGLLPAPGDLSPDLPLAADAAGGRQAAAAAPGGRRRSSWWSCRRAEECCGFGGTFAIKNADTSTAMLADKMRHVLDTGAEVCTAGDSSCLMHIGGGLSRIRAGTRTAAPGRDPGLHPGASPGAGGDRA